ncbi:MAG: hypothetical protein K6G90_00105 [Clostridia bacterium]|nr:hypothetical protein [Clostridia bacterium]
MQAFFQKILALFMSVLVFFGIVKQQTPPSQFIQGVSSGKQGNHHVQGVAVDEKNCYIYYSFTTRLVKTDFAGNLIGTVEGLVGHLGCIALNPADGLIYGSLEYKHDGIGQGVGTDESVSDGFYIAVFDPAKITRRNMSAEQDGVMTAAFLPEVLVDYTGYGKNGEPHRYGCSGIDGLCFAPLPGASSDERFLYVAYGVYSDLSRSDNDHQILLCFVPNAVKTAARPLTQTAMHENGPGTPLHKYFVYTGNTEYGVQNLEYDPAHNALLMAVYKGEKPAFPNYDIYAADLSRPAEAMLLTGLGETGEALTLLGAPVPESLEISGWRFSYGQFGIQARSGGGFYIVQPETEDGEENARVYTYAFAPSVGFTKEDG